MSIFDRSGDDAGTSPKRPRGRLAVAGTGLIAAAALLFSSAAPAQAQSPVSTPVSKASAALKDSLIDRYSDPYKYVNICQRYPWVCEQRYEEPVLIPEPDPGPYKVSDIALPLQQLDVHGLELNDLQIGPLGFGG